MEEQAEKERLKMEEQIEIIMRQTTYNHEEAKNELIKHKYNTFEVIRNYVSGEKSNLNNENNQNTKIKKSTNQEIYTQIRNYLGFVPLQ
jgi:hypothetical protein